ncbi:hypothetical protein [Runella salmonicolor]|uniref:Uncharacterized protein n=1 Tax=Runella salmonicolor TaxID=2950278 RepID=A0ABT1FSS8_9BACT|nr:hypothetical protein [Runella salmonicolor]MCP1384816.1 hypothetical protein [Runella salmonicolor]
MKTILQNKNLRKSFLITISLILILILVIRFWVLPNFEPELLPGGVIPKDPTWLAIITKLLDSIFVSLSVTVCIGLFLFYIELPDDEKKFEIIESFKLKELFEGERNDTDIWYFSGGLGRHTRVVTIPELAKISQKTNQHKSIKIQIIDPANEIVCANYANYRKGLNSASKLSQEWTVEFVRNESIATIISALLYKNKYPLLDLSICLKNNFSTLRIDLSTKVAIITKEDLKEPALICRSGSFLYRTYREELLQTFKEYKPINTALNFPYNIESISIQDVKTMLEKLDINIDLENETILKVLEIIKNKINPYE